MIKEKSKEKSIEHINRRPPSYYRYKDSHPTISFTLTKELKVLLDAMKGQRSYGRATRDIVAEELKLAEEAEKVNKVLKQRIKQLENELKDKEIWYNCSVCDKKIIIHAGSESHKAIQKFLKEAGWRHTRCGE